MDKYERRRQALQALVDKMGRGAIAKIAKEIGRDASYVSRMLYPKGKSGKKNIGDDLTEAMDKAYPGWLNGDSTASRIALLDKNTDIVTILRYDTGGSMGGGIVLHDQPGVIESWRVTKEWLTANVRGYTSVSNLCIVTGFGDSMRPTYSPGDPLIVDKGVTTVEFDSVYFFRIGNDGYVKRLQRIPTQDGLIIRALSDNRDLYQPFDITPDMDFAVLGRVVQVWRREDY